MLVKKIGGDLVTRYAAFSAIGCGVALLRIKQKALLFSVMRMPTLRA